MYHIYELNERQRNGGKKFECRVQIQDGTEHWREATLQEAIFSVIQAARTLNGSYIRKDDIEIHGPEPILPLEVSVEDYNLLTDIKRGAKVVLDCMDPLVKYRVTPDECEMIVAIREGRR